MKADRPVPGRLRSWLLCAAPYVAVCGLLALALFGSESTICGFANVTGVPCPGCGMTRAMGELLRGNVAAAHRQHPLVWLLFAELLAAGTFWGLHCAGWIRWRNRRWVAPLLGLTAVLLIVVWIVRLANGTAPTV